MSSTHATGSEPLFSRPSNPVGIVAIVMAAITGVLHLLAVMNAIQFSQTLAILFALNGLGFLGGIVLFLTRYWRRELYLVAALYALATVLALFVFQGFGVDAFFRQGQVNPMAVITKAAEILLAVVAGFLYANEG
jgi:small basic protein